jgi:hypothetical protein
MDVSDAEIDAWFGVRNAAPAVRQELSAALLDDPKTAWPTASIKALIYAAGAYVKGTGPVINLGVTRDSDAEPDERLHGRLVGAVLHSSASAGRTRVR